MELTNEIYRLEDSLSGDGDRTALFEALETLVTLLSPFAPHACEQMWRDLGHENSLVDAAWPKVDEEALRETAIEVAVQVNGKVRARVSVPVGADEATHREAALNDAAVKGHMEGKALAKAIVIPGRLINLVVK